MGRFGVVSGVFAMGLVVVATVRPAAGQTGDAALRDRVNQLVERLGADKADVRQAAEEALVKLGARVLPLLPEGAAAVGAERRQRLDRVREALQRAAEAVNLGASRVTLRGKGIRLSEAVQRLQAASGNPITDLREAEGGEASNPSLDLEIVDRPFLEALDVVCRQAGTTPAFFTGDGTVALMPGAPAEKTPIVYTGPFRVAFKQLAVVRDLQTGAATASAQFDVAWEPRLRPMLLKLEADGVAVVDDQKRVVPAEVKDESTEVLLRPENPVAEINLPLKAPDRSARSLESLKVKAAVTVPAGLRSFRFPTLAVDKPVTIKQGEIAVTLAGTEVDEQVWKVEVELEYPGEGPAFESFRQGLFNNRLWLQKADGTRFEHNGGFSNTAAGDGRLGFEYLFVDAPGKPADYGLVYEAPSRVESVPLEFEFKKVDLP